MMELGIVYNQTVNELHKYEEMNLEQKANDVYDNFMRTFVLEVSFIRSMQFDVSTILQKINDNQS